jgi:hypothetical protein
VIERPSVNGSFALLETAMLANKMSRFEIFIGTWNTTGEVLQTEDAPATTLSATDTYQWLSGKHFIAHDADARFGDIPSRSMEVIGFDATKKRYLARSFDDQGASEVFEVALRGKNWSLVGATARFKGKFVSKNDELHGLWELKGKKAGWQPWIKLKLVRA